MHLKEQTHSPTTEVSKLASARAGGRKIMHAMYRKNAIKRPKLPRYRHKLPIENQVRKKGAHPEQTLNRIHPEHTPLTQHANYAPRAANRSSRAACAAFAKPSTDGPAASTPRLEFTSTCDSTPANTRYRSAAEAPCAP